MQKDPEISTDGDVTVITLGPEYESLDETALEDLGAKLLQSASAADPPRVVIDLPHTSFFGSSFIEVLFRCWHRLNNQEGGKFALSSLKPYCAEVIEVTNLDRLWPIYETRDEAVQALKGDNT